MRCHKSGVGLLPCCGERENYIGAQGDGQDNWQNVLAGGLNTKKNNPENLGGISWVLVFLVTNVVVIN